MKLALFDLDKTLIDGDSEELWVEFLIAEGELAPSVRGEVQRFGEDYVAGRMDFVAWQKFMLAPQARIAPEYLLQLRDRYTRASLVPIIRDWMQPRLDDHRAQGHQTVVITATNRWIVEPVVAALGADDLLATEPEMQAGRFTGDVAGEPCFQGGKLVHLRRWLSKRGVDAPLESWAYSDSYNDLPLLEYADHAVAVTPDARLAATARERNWEILTGPS